MSNFFDGVVNSPSEEMLLCTSRVDSAHGCDSVFSLPGRAGCICRVVTHSAGIGLKPLYYMGYWSMTKLSLAIIPSIKDRTNDPEFQEYAQKNKEEAAAVKSIVENPELVDRFHREIDALPFCALVAPFSQTVQLLKAVGGIIHPGLYYQHDPYCDSFEVLETIAREVGCSSELIEAFQNGPTIIHEKLYFVSNRDYYAAIFRRDLAFISDKMEGDDLPSGRKQLLLSMLDPLGSKSGIKGCAPALARILEQIRAQVDVPTDPVVAIPHLANQFKQEVVNRMIIQAEQTPESEQAGWHKVVYGLAHDPSHRGNAMIVAVGESIGIAAVTIARSSHDTLAHRMNPLSEPNKQLLRQVFFEMYTLSELTISIMAQLNSQSDGSPGLKILRMAIFQQLCEHMQQQDGDDRSLEAVQMYYLHGGRGSPSDANFTDLNVEAIRSFARIFLGDDDPFAVFDSESKRTLS